MRAWEVSLTKLSALLAIIHAAILVAVPEPAQAADVKSQLTLDSWQTAIANTPAPSSNACFEASFPDLSWTEVTCAPPPTRFFGKSPLALPTNPKVMTTREANRDLDPEIVGGSGLDWMAQGAGLPNGQLIYGTGKFAGVSTKGESGTGGANDYSIQLNSNYFTTAACNGHTKCQGWEQFIYSTYFKGIFIEFWLLNYGTCPNGWMQNGNDCYLNSSTTTVGQIPISSLQSLSMSASAGGGGWVDTLTFMNGTTAYSATDPHDSTLGLCQGWNQAEYNVFGDGNLSQATFTSPTTIEVEVGIGTSQNPNSCVNNSTTGETNNLTAHSCTVQNPPRGSSTAPYVFFFETN